MHMIDPDDHQAFAEAARAVLHGNRVQVDGYRYTRPAPSTYEHQWLWDSCFHAIVYRHFDPDMAADELRSLVAHQVTNGPDAGMIPHMTYWRGGGADLWGADHRSIITQPPLVAVAALQVQQAGIALAGELYEPICAHHEWLDRRRDPDGDDLVSILHPWESGWDASPRWDRAMRLSNPTDDDARNARIALAQQLRANQCAIEQHQQAGLFSVEAIDVNAIRVADLEALAELAYLAGKPEEAPRWEARAAAVRTAVRTKLLEPGPRDLEGPDELPIEEPGAAPFVALFGGCASAEQAEQLVGRLLSPSFATPFPVPTTPTGAPSFSPGRYWRGNVWPSVNWLIWQGLRRYGYTDAARALAQRTVDLVRQHGFWEYFNPLTGQGLGAQPQSWTTLAFDMLQE